MDEDPSYENVVNDLLEYVLNRATSNFPLGECVDLEQELWEKYGLASLPKVPELDSREKLSGATWTALVVRQNHFVFQSHENPLHDVLFPIVRSSFEHAVYLWLIARNQVDENAFRQLDKRSLKHWQKTFDNPDSEIPRSVARALPRMALSLMPTRREKQHWSLIFEQVCQRFENGDGLYVNFGRLSSHVHPGIQTGSLFVADILDPESRLAQAAENDTRLHNLLRLSLISAGSALAAHDEIFGSRQFESLVDRIANVFGLSDDELRLPLKVSSRKRR